MKYFCWFCFKLCCNKYSIFDIYWLNMVFFLWKNFFNIEIWKFNIVNFFNVKDVFILIVFFLDGVNNLVIFLKLFWIVNFLVVLFILEVSEKIKWMLSDMN